MPTMHDEIVVRGHRIKNRLAMLPIMTFSFQGEGGHYYGKQHIAHYTSAAESGIGLIIVQSTSVVGVGDNSGMWTSGSLNALREIVKNAHARGATIMIQLSGGADYDSDINNWSTEQVRGRQNDLKLAALQAAEIGFDGVEYHFAHGFTLCRFMDAAFNQRTDEFGGSLENRLRILTDVLPEIRANTPEQFIISARMGEYTPSHDEGVATAQYLEGAGLDLLSISFGMTVPDVPVPDGFDFSAVTYSGYAIKQVVSVPVIGVNAIRTAEEAKKLIEQGYADICGVGRAMLADPRFAAHVLEGAPAVECFACKRCLWFTDHTKCPARRKKNDESQ